MANSNPERPLALSRHIALRYVGAHRGGGLVSFMSAISILGLALGIALLLTVLSIMNGFDREMRRNVLGIVPHISLRGDAGPTSAQWRDLQASLAAYPGIASVSPVIETQAVVASEAGNRGVMANGVDAGLESEYSVLDRFMLEGDLGRLGQTRWGIVLGDTLARDLQVGVGGRVRLYAPALIVNPLAPTVNSREFEVSGIFRVGSRELDSRLVVLNREAGPGSVPAARAAECALAANRRCVGRRCPVAGAQPAAASGNRRRILGQPVWRGLREHSFFPQSDRFSALAVDCGGGFQSCRQLDHDCAR